VAQVQVRGKGRSARQDETAQGRQLGVHRVNLGLKPGNLAFDHPQGGVFAGFIQMPVRGAKIGAKVEKVV